MSDRNLHIGKGFNAQELFEYLSRFTPEERKERDVFIRLANKGEVFSIQPLDYIEDDTYGSFGTTLPCLILNDTRFAPDDDD